MNKDLWKKSSMLGMTVAVTMAIMACEKPQEKQGSESSMSSGVEELTTLDQKVMYIKSYKMISKGVANGAEFDPVIMERAIYDGKHGVTPLIPVSDQLAVMMELKKEFDAKEKLERARIGQQNIVDGAAYLASHAEEDNVIVTPSGLQYKVLKAVEGDVPTPKPSDLVKVNYTGTLIDGTVFDTSGKKGGPVNMTLDKVIAGWKEGIPLMKEGETFEFVVPSALAYGEDGQASTIFPNAVLKFVVELVKINPDITAENLEKTKRAEERARARAEKAIERAEARRQRAKEAKESK